MRAPYFALLLAAGVAAAAGPPFSKPASDNCSAPSASCLAATFTATSKYTVTGTTGPQLESTGAASFEIRTGATGGTAGFKLYTTNNLTGTILEVGEIITGTPTAALTLDQSNLNLISRGIEMFGALVSSSGGADAPMVLKGGVVSTANTSRVASFRTGFDIEQMNLRGASGGYQIPGVATASLVACNGSAAGLHNLDTTKGTPTFCDGTTQKTVPYILTFNGSQDVGSVAAHSCTNFTIPAVGVVDADVAFCDPPSGIDTGLTADCNTGVDVMGWKVCNHTTGAIDPANGAYNARVLRP